MCALKVQTQSKYCPSLEYCKINTVLSFNKHLFRHTVSVDEATSLQAIERNAPDKPVEPGRVARQEFEYTRHGTTTLTAGLDVVTGRIVCPTLEATRTEPEFVAHLGRTVDTDPEAEWIFVVDRLNTHMSESLVKFVAERCGLRDALGKKVKVAS